MTELKLIDRDFESNNHAYGDLKIFSTYLGLKSIPKFFKGEIPHGWIIKERNIIPDFVIGSDGLGFTRKSKRLYVARKDQQDFLTREGFNDVHAIGHPITYLKKGNYQRIRKSLLIMPAHSLNDTKENWEKLDTIYASFLQQYIVDFSLIAVCIHPQDLKKNNWLRVRSLVSQVIEGADIEDSNSYERMAQLFSTFEYVTTNYFGSHVAYGSYFGSKISVCGPWFFKREEFENVVFYKNQPCILEILEEWHESKSYKEWYPQFFCSPLEASSNIEWAKWQLGSNCKRSKRVLFNLFGLGLREQFYARLHACLRKFKLKVISILSYYKVI